MPKIHISFQQVIPTNGLFCLCEHCKHRVAQGKVGMHVYVNGVSHILVDEAKESPHCARPTRFFKFFEDLHEAMLAKSEIADRIDRDKDIGFLKLLPGQYQVTGASRVQQGLTKW